MKKYLVIDYYSWDGDFGLHKTKLCDTLAQATEEKFKLVDESVKSWLREGRAVVINAQDLTSIQLDNLPENTIIVEDMGHNVILSVYGDSVKNHEEIIIKEMEV